MSQFDPAIFSLINLIPLSYPFVVVTSQTHLTIIDSNIYNSAQHVPIVSTWQRYRINALRGAVSPCIWIIIEVSIIIKFCRTPMFPIIPFLGKTGVKCLSIAIFEWENACRIWNGSTHCSASRFSSLDIILPCKRKWLIINWLYKFKVCDRWSCVMYKY